MSEEVVLQGVSLSRGICIGLPFFLEAWKETKQKKILNDREITEEILKYRHALFKSKEELMNLKSAFEKEQVQVIDDILNSHLEMLSDPFLHEDVERRIFKEKKPLSHVLRVILREYKKRCKKGELRERIKDILDIFQRVLKHASLLHGKSMDIPQEAVVFVEELVPSDAFEADKKKIKAFVSLTGGYSSHAAIIARSKGIPYIVNIDVEKISQLSLEQVIVDGVEGKVVINPSDNTLSKYRILEAQLKEDFVLPDKEEEPIKFYGNIQRIEDIDDIFRYKACGVGLFRSEYLFLEKKNFPTEEDQFAIYSSMAKKLKGLPLVIRIFDICLEKQEIMFLKSSFSNKFALGQRGVRFLLDNPTILKTQLRAIVRSSLYGDVKILIPFVTDLEEFFEVKQMVEAVSVELSIKPPSIGCMIEIPSAVLMIDKIAEVADFLSIGSNDLIQYTMAAERGDARMDKFFHKLHPAILRIINMVLLEAKKQKKLLFICGEIVTEEKHLPCLIDLGVEAISIAPCHILRLRKYLHDNVALVKK